MDEPHQRVRRRRRLAVVALVPFLLVGGFLGYGSYRRSADDAALRAAIADADRLDPGWRLAELEAKRAHVPPAKDSAALVTKVGRTAIPILNTGTLRQDLRDVSSEVNKLAPATPLTPRQTQLLRTCLGPLAGPLDDARTIADLPDGRYLFNCSPAFHELAPHVDNVGITIWLLTQDLKLRAQDGDLEGAWKSCQAMMNVARSSGDEPSWVQVSRAYHGAEAVKAMERILAQGQVPSEALAHTQTLLKEEMAHPGLLISLRGRRAHVHHLYSELAAGNVSMGDMMAEIDSARTKSYGAPGIQHHVRGMAARSGLGAAHAWLLRTLNEAVEIARERGENAAPALRELQGRVGDPPELALEFSLDHVLRFLDPKKNRARLECASTALAVERYRLKHGRWPATLADLVPDGFLPEAPQDPYDGEPLRYRPTEDGVVVFSVGSEQDAAGDALERNIPANDEQRLEFRLWNVDRRRALP
ncbi:MAG: hypothetical protein L0Y71_02975 [Gemmataceae bacterium]|nr:hypothetical protein [Gemmataceae bacterium]